MKFLRDHHLAFVLDTYGGEIAAAVARRTLAGDSLAAKDRPAFLEILAHHGSAQDLRRLVVDEAPAHPELLDTLVDSWPERRIKPALPYAQDLSGMLSSETAAVRIAALRLAGFWRTTEMADDIEALALSRTTAAPIRSVALNSYGSLRGKAATGQLAAVAVEKTAPAAVRNSAVEALAATDITVAADTVLKLVEDSADADDLAPILRPVLSKTNGPGALAGVISDHQLSPEKARKIAGALAGLGRTNRELTAVLNRMLGIKDDAPGGAPEDYDARRVAEIVAAVKAGDGDARRGREVYQLAQLNCVACHQIDGVGGVIGPSLDTVGAGLPLDQIVDSVLYPAAPAEGGIFCHGGDDHRRPGAHRLCRSRDQQRCQHLVARRRDSKTPSGFDPPVEGDERDRDVDAPGTDGVIERATVERSDCLPGFVERLSGDFSIGLAARTALARIFHEGLRVVQK